MGGLAHEKGGRYIKEAKGDEAEYEIGSEEGCRIGEEEKQGGSVIEE